MYLSPSDGVMGYMIIALLLIIWLLDVTLGLYAGPTRTLSTDPPPQPCYSFNLVILIHYLFQNNGDIIYGHWYYYYYFFYFRIVKKWHVLSRNPILNFELDSSPGLVSHSKSLSDDAEQLWGALADHQGKLLVCCAAMFKNVDIVKTS